ncbi:putative S-locus glycoprotein [Helianthus annuus]|nr:putative S-locus glycoprotein [Helianthus annuus]
MSTILPIILCSLVFFNIQTTLSTNTLIPHESFVDGFTLISSNQRFEFGFFSLGHSSSRNLYLGIWYYNLPLTVVWVANRNNPIRDSFGEISLKENGTLILYDRSKGIVWSTDNITITSNFTPVLQLLDSGNLVIRDDGSNKTIFWQSFDFPTDTLLPDLKLDVGLHRFLRSWKSSEDPSDGVYSFSLEPPEAPQLVLRSGSRKLFRWGPFDGTMFSGGTSLTSSPLFQTIYASNSEGFYFKYELLDESILSRLVISPTGLLQYFTWRENVCDWWGNTTLA